jgi:site-specific DNA-methyltransferase (adenine-specific)
MTNQQNCLVKNGQKELGQYMTPDWVPLELIARYFPREQGYIEPSCGRGAFLGAFPTGVPAIGVEIDPEMARFAQANTGRPVIVGDFRAVDIPIQATAIVGNPPFQQSTILGFLDRAWDLLPDEGRVGFILPCYALQTASTVTRLSERWSIRQDLLPRNLFPRLRHPLMFAVLTKGVGGKLYNFALFHEQHAVTQMQRRYRELLQNGEKSVWAAVTRAALEALGGAGSLAEIYREVEGHRPTSNKFWQAKIRQTLQIIGVQVRRGYWALPQPSLFAGEAVAA